MPMTFRFPSAAQVAGTYQEGLLRLEIPAIPPSPNTYNGRHWSHYRRLRKAWSWWVKTAVLQAGCGSLQWPRSRILVTRISQRRLDPDNAMAALKCVIDGLRDAKVIENDTAEHVEVPPVNQQIGRPSRTVIEITRTP